MSGCCGEVACSNSVFVSALVCRIHVDRVVGFVAMKVVMGVIPTVSAAVDSSGDP